MPRGSDTPYALNVDRRRNIVWVTGNQSDALHALDVKAGTWRSVPLPPPGRVHARHRDRRGRHGLHLDLELPELACRGCAADDDPRRDERRGAVTILLRHRWFYLSCLAAFTAGHMVNYSVIIYARVIGSDLLSGIGFGLAFGPPIVLGWYAGVLCDQPAPGRLIQAAQAVFMLAIVLLWGRRGAREPAARICRWCSRRCLPASAGRSSRPRAWPRWGADRARRRDQISVGDLQPARDARLRPRAALAIASRAASSGWDGVFGAALGLFALGSLTLLAVPTQASARVHAPVGVEIRKAWRRCMNPLLLQRCSPRRPATWRWGR